MELLQPVPGYSVLDIGCGTGESLVPFLNAGLDVTGIEPSAYMLNIARKKIGHRADLYQGCAEALPFEDNAFHYASFFTTLEFTEMPQKAIEEACRVAKDKVFIGVLNKYALKAVHRRMQGFFGGSVYNEARFFSIWELKKMVYDAMGNVPVKWRTVCLLPGGSAPIARWLKRAGWIQKNPFGAFIGIVVVPVPQFYMTPLPLKCKAEVA
jgi:SAM-dependent methyltransferase